MQKLLIILCFMLSFAGASSVVRYHKTDGLKTHLLDSLYKGDALGKLVERTYKGTIILNYSSFKQRCRLTIYNYEHSGDGVFEMTVQARGSIQTLQGRMYTQRGDAQDQDATVYQFILFATGNDSAVEPMNFRYLGNKLELLDRNFNRKKKFLSIEK